MTYSNSEQPLNIFSTFVTLSNLKFDKFNDDSELQPENISFILSTESVTKEDKFNDVNELQS